MQSAQRSNEIALNMPQSFGDRFVSRLSQAREVLVVHLHDLLNNFNENGTKVVAGIALGASALTLAGCAPTSHETPQATQSTIGEASSTPTPTETATTAPTTGIELVTTQPSTYADMEGASQDAFNVLPGEQQEQYFAYQMQDIVNYAEGYSLTSGDPNDKLPASVSEDNTPQEIMTLMSYSLRVTTSLPEADANKALVGALVGGTSNNMYADYKAYLDKAMAIDNTGVGARVLGADHGLALDKIVSAGELQKENGVTYRDITVTDSLDSKQKVIRVFLKTITVGDQTFSWWLNGGTAS